LRSTLSMSMTAQGVPYSRAILAASGVVICYSVVAIVIARSEATKQSRFSSRPWIASLRSQ
jgi:uncharacterized protein (DUF2342 family)